MDIKQDKFLEHLESVEKQVTAIEHMMAEDWMNINIQTATAGINPALYACIYQAQDDPDPMFKGLAVMIRTWINIQRAIKTGDLQRMKEEGTLSDFTPEDIEASLERNHRLLPEQDLTIIVVNYNGVPIMQIIENQDKGSITYNLLKEIKNPQE